MATLYRCAEHNSQYSTGEHKVNLVSKWIELLEDIRYVTAVDLPSIGRYMTQRSLDKARRHARLALKPT